MKIVHLIRPSVPFKVWCNTNHWCHTCCFCITRYGLNGPHCNRRYEECCKCGNRREAYVWHTVKPYIWPTHTVCF